MLYMHLFTSPAMIYIYIKAAYLSFLACFGITRTTPIGKKSTTAKRSTGAAFSGVTPAWEAIELLLICLGQNESTLI